MKKEISIYLLALSLVACGGDSSSDSSLGINKDFASGVRGVEQEPTLTSDTVSEGDTIVLNSNLTGTVSDGSSVIFNFTPTETQKLALILSSAATDLDLGVSSTDLDLMSDDENSNEAIIFEATAGQLYSVEVESYEGAGSFELKFVEANRSSFGLSANEYIVEAEYTSVQTCVENEQTSTYNEIYDVSIIINWKDGYVVNLSNEYKTSFKSVTDNSFTAVSSDSGTEGNESYENTFTLNYTTNFETGELTGTAVSETTSVENSITEVCTSNISITANVVL
tara:strand:+ start:2318 stop:3160 length:843 start_codon:yes stop_codon:yes gene_type:complete